MLNRRHLRVKVLQSLYAFIQSGSNDLLAGEKELLFGIEKIYDLYLHQLLLLIQVGRQAEKIQEDNRTKMVPSSEDLNPNTRFVDNACLKQLAESWDLEKKIKDRKVSWAESPDIARKIFLQFRESKPYQQYMLLEQTDFEQDKEIVLKLFKNFVCEFELVHNFYEDKSIYWIDDWELVNKMLIKSLKGMGYETAFSPMSLYKDPEDKEFARNLFKKTVLNDKDFSPMISEKTQNWDIERIALMDVLIMKMALCEIIKFPEVPVKVSLNEYIELSKMYSTPKSKIFVNGVLDKLVEELVQTKKINKSVKGLAETSKHSEE